MTAVSAAKQAAGRSAEAWGRSAEVQARAEYCAHGAVVLAERFRAPRESGGGEIDLVVRLGDCVVFVEVKARRRAETALGSVSPAQWRRLEAAALSFLAARSDLNGLDMRFDLAIVTPDQKVSILENVASFDAF